MEENKLSSGTVKFIRSASILMGVLLLLSSFLANSTGLSVSCGISRNQIGFIVCGLLLIGAGISGRRFPGIYKGTGVVLLNILVAVFILELVSIAAVKIICGGEFSLRQRKIEEGHLDVTERMTANGIYAPFVVWRSNPLLNTDSVTVDQSGYRDTPGNPEDPRAATVMLLGGSSMWGTGSSDRQTIPAHLQRILEDSAAVPVRVLNLGQTAWCSTQEVIELMLQLRGGNRPDVVVFYDGFNDVWGAYEAGYTGSHHSEQAIAAKLNGTEVDTDWKSPYIGILRNTNTWLLVSTLRQRFAPSTQSYTQLETYATMGISPDALARRITDTYLANMEIVLALSERYDFKCLFVVQPTLWYGGKQPTEYEMGVLSGSNEFFLAGKDPAFSELLTKTYDLFISETGPEGLLLSYADMFDEIEETVYTDYSGVHVYGWCNEMVARRLAEDIRQLEPALFEDSLLN